MLPENAETTAYFVLHLGNLRILLAVVIKVPNSTPPPVYNTTKELRKTA